jgi:hypothetical protein
MSKTEIYKGYEISPQQNEWGYFEATPKDCDSPQMFSKTLKGLKLDIDEKTEE